MALVFEFCWEIFSEHDLQEILPPLHPHCACIFVALDNRTVVQYHQKPERFIAIVEQVALEITHGTGGVFYLDHSAANFGISEYTLVALSQQVPLQILHSKDTVTRLSEDFDVFLNNAKQWLDDFLFDAGAAAAGIGGQIGHQYETGIALWEKNPLLSIAYFADAISLTLVSSTWAGIESRYSEMSDDPSLYSISNFFTLGIVEMLDNTIFPDVPWSFEHWMNIVGSSTLVYGAYKFGIKDTVGVDDLAKQIIFDEQQAVPTQLTEYGQQYNQIISITGVNGRKIDVVFGWIRNLDGVVRLTTAIPTRR